MGAMPTRVEGRGGGTVGAKIDFRDGHWIVPDHPIIPFIEGDGTGPDIWRAASKVFDAAVARTSGGKRSIVRHAGEVAHVALRQILDLYACIRPVRRSRICRSATFNERIPPPTG